MKLVIFACLVLAAVAVPLNRITTSSEVETLFARFKTEHGKAYFDEKDETYRKSVFGQNLEKIRLHNEAAARGEHTFTMAMNEFGDLTTEEFFARYTGFAGQRNEYIRSMNYKNLTHAAADSVDWTTSNAVTPVKNQGQCGSCWAFSTTGAIEGAWAIAKKDLESLSEQQLMDCSKAEGNNSCEGGLMDYAFEFVIKNSGICTEASYPYKQKDENSCTKCSNVATISAYTDVQKTDEALAQAITQQPVAVAIEADQNSFQFYSSGVMTGKCGTRLDHGVLAVGYGTLDGTQYWKVKNSWGSTWGMQGYILLERGISQRGGQCGILESASYPTV